MAAAMDAATRGEEEKEEQARAVFEAAVEHVKTSKTMKMKDADKLRLYGLYKQAVAGDCNTPAPSMLSVVAHAKWKAWKDLAGMSQPMAMQAYIASTRALDPTCTLPSIVAEAAENPAEEIPVVEVADVSAETKAGEAVAAPKTASVDAGPESKAATTASVAAAEAATDAVESAAEAIESAARALKAAAAAVPATSTEAELAEEPQAEPAPALAAAAPVAPSGAAAAPLPRAVEPKPRAASGISSAISPGPASSSEKSAMVVDLEGPTKPAVRSSSRPSTFAMTVMASLGVSAVGVCGFLVTTLSPTALTFLVLIVAGLMGVVGAFAALLDSNGLIAMYPELLRRILLDKTLVEVILEGTILKRIRDFVTEIYPLLYCKTEEDRLEVLANMSQKTRELMTTRGVVNLLPAWQQRITLSSQEFARQQARLASSASAFRPAIDAQPCGTRKPNNQAPRLEQQIELASKLLTRSIQDRVAAWILKRVNPEVCKGVSIALALSVIMQLRASARARRAVVAYVRRLSFSSSAVGAVIFALLAIAHRASRVYDSRRQLQLLKGR